MGSQALGGVKWRLCGCVWSTAGAIETVPYIKPSGPLLFIFKAHSATMRQLCLCEWPQCVKMSSSPTSMEIMRINWSDTDLISTEMFLLLFWIRSVLLYGATDITYIICAMRYTEFIWGNKRQENQIGTHIGEEMHRLSDFWATQIKA